MKILGGKLKGRNFFMSGDIRPTQNLVRKAIFDILGQDLSGEDVLELFAGSGALGFEALSRGAGRVSLVEKEPKCVEVILENIRLLNLPYNREEESRSIELIAQDAFSTIKNLAKQGRKFDLIFIDPPYERELGKKALNHLEAYDILHATSIVVVQHSQREILPERAGRILLYREEKYGATCLAFYKINP